MPLGHVAEARIVAEGGPRHTEDVDLAREQVGEAEEALGDRRLSRPVRTQDEDHLAGPNGEVDIGDDSPLAVTERGAAQLDDGGRAGHAHPSPVRSAARLASMTAR